MLKEETEKLQMLTNNTFTFNDEDNVATFNKRDYDFFINTIWQITL